MDYHEIGIFFVSSESPPKKYAAEAWELFMRQCDSRLLEDSSLYHGEVTGHLPGFQHLFCIAVRTQNISSIQYIKEVFSRCDDARLAPLLDRVRETDVIVRHRLKPKGKIDSQGRLVTEKWGRIDHDNCKTAGWPYFPEHRPHWLSDERHSELDTMSDADFRGFGVAAEKKTERKEKRHISIPFGGILKQTVRYALLLTLLVVGAYGLLNREKLVQKYHDSSDEWKLRRTLGSEGFDKYRDGLAILKILRVPPELPLDALNSRLAERGYCALACSDDSLVIGRLECSVWFSENRSGGDVVTQGFLSMDLYERSGTMIWTELAKGTVKLSELGKEIRGAKEASLLAAIDELDLADLPDGRTVKHYQKEGIDYTRTAAEARAAHQQELAERKLRGEILQHVAKCWIMSQRLHLSSGSTRDVIILSHNRGKAWVRTFTGKMMIPVNMIQKVESFKEEDFAEQLKRALAPVRREFTQDWQHQLCDNLIAELSAKYATYGPAYPEAWVVCLRTNETTGEMEAVVRTGRNECTVRKGEKMDGFQVVGMDSETNSILLLMGIGGEVLRIWPGPLDGQPREGI